jgi:hypothetical protein
LIAMAKKDLWPKCPKCKGPLGIAFYGVIRRGYEFCTGCNWRREVDWILKAVLKGLQS